MPMIQLKMAGQTVKADGQDMSMAFLLFGKMVKG